ncbi:uncharacterized protein Z520_01707 [Fonsecaea multimorphosa CBS 102226]|uniref:Zn(2)-C6 fungal-type domain-containing protein n=1 Tax=Fonsecaea multimorphosa CBS 102226 TaxID=1442371 RepID=A0A0D2KID3_9EURO|nr:uncharacterized protein Z520_01707 [Fonsecaea multimorphosa CBS 102226]KIY03240.1 hypothetical protein Z520_01707 [Fonsecaea multimorphosa CBS 102226]OAL30479.1 hypothetical protein AYO22_01677 [Fonsecaea multimorphosa]
MPPSLRKACHACTTAKRRCVPQLPQCARCAEKGLRCTYDLEPVTNLETDSSRQPHTTTQSPWEPLPSIIFDSVASAHEAAVRSYSSEGYEMLPVMANQDTVMLVVERHLGPIPLLTFQQRTTPYIHRQVLLATKLKSASLVLGDVDGSGRTLGLNSAFLEGAQQHLLSLEIEQLTFTEFLGAFHMLAAILLSLILSFGRSSPNAQLPPILLDLWTTWTKHFHTILPRTLSSDLSAWQAWCTAESARRTLLYIILVDGMVEVAQKGFCHYRPMVESLPFDARTGLWEADTAEEWRAAVAAHGGAESELMSWAEFIRIGGPEPRGDYDGMLQRMLLIIHFGRAAADVQ